MAYQILATKLYNPPLHAHFVQRSALAQRLEHGLQHGKRLTLVSAPAGFGKSTLVSQWLNTRMSDEGSAVDAGASRAGAHSASFGWISLDEGDNDPIRFLIYVVTALQSIKGEIGKSALATLQSPQVAPLPELVEAVINEIAAVACPLIIVLDDYHLIKNRDVHTLVQLFLERQPASMHTVIITREDPPLPLPRMRVRGQVTEIRERDLRFTQDEAALFFNQTMGLNLAAQAVTALEDQTEGWIAGLQLAAIALQEYDDEQSIQSFVTTFAGNDRYVVDYLVSEVLQRQPESVRTFLITTSILERMCGPLCDALMQDSDATPDGEHSASSFPHPSTFILDQLERANMFLIPLDKQRQWYRYHHLFAELLQHTLKHTPEMDPSALHRRAGSWYEQHGFLQDAVNHTFKARDWTFAAELIERHAMDRIGQSQVGWLQEWIGRLPADVVQNRLGLGIFHAWVLTLSFRTDYRPLVNEKLLQAEQILNTQHHPPLAAVGPGGALVPIREWVIGQASAIRSQLLLASFNESVDPHEVINLSMRSLELLPEIEQTVRAICTITIAHGYLMLGDPVEAARGFANVLQLGFAARNYFSVATAYFYQSRLAYFTGQQDRALAICQEGLDQLNPYFKSPDQEFPAIRSLYVMQGVVLLERGRLDEAERILNLATNRVGYAPWVEIIAYEALVRLWELRDDTARVIAILNRMDTMGPQIASCAEAMRYRHLSSRAPDEKLREAARRWAETHAPNMATSLVVNGIGPYQVDAEYIVLKAWLQVQIALGRPQTALETLAPILASARAKGIVQRVSELSSIEAAALQAVGARVPAPQELAARDDARPVGASPALSARAAAAPPPSNEAGPSALLDPLSERELEVLRLLAQGLTLAEVADRLCLSPYTVKAHTQNIYAKLDAHSRVEAANKARALGLI